MRERAAFPRGAWGAAAVALVSLLSGGAEGQPGGRKTATCTVQQGDVLIAEGRYEQAIRELSCVIQAQPTGVDGYRARIEAQLLLGRYSDALADYALVTARVLPAYPEAAATILEGYAARLSADPGDVHALTGDSFARWWLFDYAGAIQELHRLLALEPDSVYANLFRGSSRLLLGASPAAGAADLERALTLAPSSPHVRFIVADAYTYGQPDAERALAEATLALGWGLDTPRVHAILAAAHLALGDELAAAAHLERHIELVTAQLLPAPSLGPGTRQRLDLVPGRTYEMPVPTHAGEGITISTQGHEVSDSILVLFSPGGVPVAGSDDARRYLAGLDWVAQETGTYRLRVTSFEGVGTGQLTVTRH